MKGKSIRDYIRKERLKFLSVALLIIVGLSLYSNSLSSEFIWDDELLVLNNRFIKSLHNLPDIFTKQIAAGAQEESNLYRPLQMLTYALNYAIWKLDLRAYHLTNVMVHILVAIMLYRLLELITKDAGLALLAAILFIGHPIHTEAVTYISGRADPLAALFILLCITFYITGSYNNKPYYFAIVWFIGALLCKETAVITPVLLLSYDLLFKKREDLSMKKPAPFFLIGLVYVMLRVTVLHFPVAATVIDQYSFIQRAPAIFQSLTMYFAKLFFPINLHMEYQPILPLWTDVQVVLGIFLSALLIGMFLITRRRIRLVAFGLAWFLINFLPVSNIYPLNAFFAEHWSYIPSFGFFILIGWAAVRIYQKGGIFKALVGLIMGIALILNFKLTWQQNEYWRNPEVFYQRTLDFSPQSARVYFRLGLYYLKRGLLDQGIEKTKKALEIDPGYVKAYENLSGGYLQRQLYDQALEAAKRGLRIDPGSPILHNNLGIIYSERGQYVEAVGEFYRAISFNPAYVQAYSNLGSTYALMGEKAKAVSAYRSALSIAPDYGLAHKNLAQIYDQDRQ